ncbi:MAG: phosphotransferase [Candidatus Hodarchaeota archaeon]
MMNSWLIDKIKLVLSEHGIRFGELSYAAIYTNPQNRGRITFLIYENSGRIPNYVVKVARSVIGRQALEREQRCLQRCIITNNFIKHQLYRFYWSDEDVAFIIEPYFRGQQITNLRNVQKASQKVLDWLIQLQKASAGPIWNKKELIRFCNTQVEQIHRYYQIKPSIENLLSELERRIMMLDDFKIQATVVHGDFIKKNMLIQGDEVKVFDWEWIQEYGWPFLDTWLYLFSISGDWKSSHSYIKSGSMIASTLTGLTRYSKYIYNLISFYNKRYNCPVDVIKCFILLTLLYIIKRDHLISEMVNGRSERFFKILKNLAENANKFWKFTDSL